MKRIRRIVLALILAFTATFSGLQVLADAGIDAGTNTYRASQGIYPLNTWSTLQPVADLRVRQISTSDTFAHPEDWQTLFNMLPSCVTLIGENIAFKSPYTDSAWFVSAWIGSEPHRINMLGPWTWQASAKYNAPDGRTYGVQLFVKGCGVTPAPAPLPTPKPPAYVPPPVVIVPIPKVIVVPVPILLPASDTFVWLPCLWHESYVKYQPNMYC